MRDIVAETMEHDFHDIMLFNEVAKFDILYEMKQVETGGFTKKDFATFKKRMKKHGEIIKEA